MTIHLVKRIVKWKVDILFVIKVIFKEQNLKRLKIMGGFNLISVI